MRKIIQIAFFIFFAGAACAMEFSAQKHDLYDSWDWVNKHSDLIRIYATGPIESNASRELERFVNANGIKSGIVLFNSPGGSLADALELGKTIRGLGFSTGIAGFRNGKMLQEGICASACAYAFAGGIHRYYSAGKTRLGLHQFYSQENVISNKTSQEVSGSLVAFLQAMGVDALAFSISVQAGPDAMAWLSTEDAVRLRFATNGVQDTVAELKLLDNQTYLKVEQASANVNGRFLFYCIKKQMFVSAGYVTTPEDARNKLDWATRSYLVVGGDTVQEQRKENNPKGITSAGSVVWLQRTLTRQEVQRLANANYIGVVLGSDGFMTYNATANLSSVRDKLQNYVRNCYQ